MDTQINEVIGTLESGNAFQQFSAQALRAISAGLESQRKPVTQETVHKALDDLEGFVESLQGQDEGLIRLTTYDEGYRERMLSSLRSVLPA